MALEHLIAIRTDALSSDQVIRACAYLVVNEQALRLTFRHGELLFLVPRRSADRVIAQSMMLDINDWLGQAENGEDFEIAFEVCKHDHRRGVEEKPQFLL